MIFCSKISAPLNIFERKSAHSNSRQNVGDRQICTFFLCGNVFTFVRWSAFLGCGRSKSHPIKINDNSLSVFSLTLTWSPMASRSCQQVSDFLNYSPRLASDILVEWKSKKKFFFFASSNFTLTCQKLI